MDWSLDNQGHTLDEHGDVGPPIVTSDVYEWAPGGFFVVHTACGRIGDFGVGGIEIIGYDADRAAYVSHFFDGQGNYSVHHIEVSGDTWTIHGKSTRATVEFSEGNTVQTVLHEHIDDRSTFVASMRVTLINVL